MNEHPTRESRPPVEDDCWGSIGVQGDGTCAELATHVHCRNCPVYANAAARLLDRPLTDEYLAEATSHFAQPKQAKEADTQSVVIFRIAGEWFALPTSLFQEVASTRVIHSLPHRRNGTLLGIVNVRGELLICVSLAPLLGIAGEPSAKSDDKHRQERLLVIRHESLRVAVVVSEVHGTHRFPAKRLQEVPATVAHAAAAHTRAILPWEDKAVGCLDEARLFQALQRSLA